MQVLTGLNDLRPFASCTATPITQVGYAGRSSETDPAKGKVTHALGHRRLLFTEVFWEGVFWLWALIVPVQSGARLRLMVALEDCAAELHRIEDAVRFDRR